MKRPASATPSALSVFGAPIPRPRKLSLGYDLFSASRLQLLELVQLLNSCNSPFLLLFLLLFLPPSLRAWGPLGHFAIAAVAEHRLSPSAQSHVAEILGLGHDADLPSIANWADDVRAAASGEGPLGDDPEARAFNAKFPTNARWHFVNLPLGTVNYQSSAAYSSDNVVHAIQRCVAVLETAVIRPEDFTKPQALRLLVHFVGDIHQPLHCGTGFYDLSDPDHASLITDPRLCDNKPNDRGGNDLWYGSEPWQQLHALWDETLVCEICRSRDYQMLAEWLESHLSKSIALSAGDYHDWPEQWAVDSVRIALKAYQHLKFGPPTMEGQRLRIPVELPSGYNDANRLIAGEQLAHAGVHLAQLLNAIQWR